jgi:hypothetical protein
MMHVVLGDGELKTKELSESLTDLWNADNEKNQTFWFVLQGKSSPSQTDRYLVTWLEKNAVYYEVITDDPDAMDPVYAQPQETHTAKKLSQKIVSLLQTKPEEGEDAEVLALFVDVNSSTAEEDRWLNGVLLAASDAGFPVRALNDGLVDIDFSATAAEPEPEEEEETPAPVKKAVAKKAAAPRTPVSEEAEPEPDKLETSNVFTREQLEEMEPAQVREVAAGLGIELQPKTRTTTYISAILDSYAEEEEIEEELEEELEEAIEELEAEAEVNVEPLLSTNGYADADVIAAKVAGLLWDRLISAVQQWEQR